MQNIIIEIVIKLKNSSEESWAVYNKTEQDKVNGDEDRIREKEGEERTE